MANKTSGTEAAITLLFGLLSLPVEGWVLSKLWLWFLVPHGLPPLDLVTAIGAGLIVALVAHQHPGTRLDTEPGEVAARTIGWGVLRPLLFLLVGLLVKAFA